MEFRYFNLVVVGVALIFSGFVPQTSQAATAPCATQQADIGGDVVLDHNSISDYFVRAQLGPCDLGTITVTVPPEVIKDPSFTLSSLLSGGVVASSAGYVGDGGGGNKKQPPPPRVQVKCPPGTPSGTVCTAPWPPNNYALLTHGWMSQIGGYFYSLASCQRAGDAWVASVKKSGGFFALWGASYDCIAL